MTAIAGDFAQALQTLGRYPALAAAIDESLFEKAVVKKYPTGPELPDGNVSDLYTALLTSTQNGFRQEGQNQATPEGVLVSIDEAIRELTLDPAEKARLGVKLCNLRTSSL